MSANNREGEGEEVEGEVHALPARLDWPKARSGHAMTYAPSSGLVFLFGGWFLPLFSSLFIE
jgi:hypothetical protein